MSIPIVSNNDENVKQPRKKKSRSRKQRDCDSGNARASTQNAVGLFALTDDSQSTEPNTVIGTDASKALSDGGVTFSEPQAQSPTSTLKSDENLRAASSVDAVAIESAASTLEPNTMLDTDAPKELTDTAAESSTPEQNDVTLPFDFQSDLAQPTPVEENAAAADDSATDIEVEEECDDDPAREYQRKCADINAAVGNQFFNPKGIAFDLKRLDHWHPALDKVPAAEVDGKLINIGYNDPRAFLPFTDAAKLAVKYNCGIGFTLEAMMFPVVCVDLDGCITDGKLNDIATSAIQIFEGRAYVERSSSGSGLHIFFFDTDAPEISTKKPALGIEVYNCRRHIVVTGNALSSVESMSFAGGTELVLNRIHKTDKFFVDRALGLDSCNALLDKHRFGVPDDDDIKEILGGIEKWKNGKEILLLYHGEWQKIKNDDGSARFKSQSEADFKFLSAIAFATDCNVDAMEAIFKKSPLAEREKAKRPDYLPRSIAKIVLNSVKIINPHKNPFDNAGFVKEIKMSLSHARTTGDPKACARNFYRVLEHDQNLRDLVGFNEFSQRIELIRKPYWRAIDTHSCLWQSFDEHELQNYIDNTYDLRGEKVVYRVFDGVAHQKSFHPVRDFFNSLPAWDHTPRAETLFLDLLGVEDTKYARAVTKHWLLAAIARIFNPACKFDYCLVLQGKQGIGKSTILSRLGGKWFGELNSIQGKDAVDILQGKWIVELTEMQATKKADNDQIKAFLSSQVDDVRLSYERRSNRFLRQCVFAATTNEAEYLRDQTGGRRFWILECKAADFDHNIAQLDVDQIWAEVWHWYHEIFADGFDSSKLDLPAEVKRIAAQIQKEHTEGSDLRGLITAFLDKPIPRLPFWHLFTKEERRKYFLDGKAWLSVERIRAAPKSLKALGKELDAEGEDGSMKAILAAVENICVTVSDFDNPGKEKKLLCFDFRTRADDQSVEEFLFGTNHGRRDKISAVEIFYELFEGERSRTNTKKIADIMRTLTDWQHKRGAVDDPEYGRQDCSFIRLDKHDASSAELEHVDDADVLV